MIKDNEDEEGKFLVKNDEQDIDAVEKDWLE